MTGYDTVSAFVGHGKSAWATWNSLPDLTDSLVTLTTTPVNIQDDTLHCIERFLVLLYDRTSLNTDVNETRKKLFTIPPAYHVLEQHVKRSVFQGLGEQELGADLGPSTRASITNKLGLAGNRERIVRTAVDHTP